MSSLALQASLHRSLLASAHWLWGTVAGSLSTVPIDPLGPIEQNPDEIRDTACRLVSPDLVCSPPEPPRPANPPNLGWLEAIVRVIALVLLVAVVGGLVLLIVRALRGARPRRRRRRRGDDPPADTVEAIGPATTVDRSREPRDWRAEAGEHRRAGRHREALRCRYRALVGDLARRGVIDEIPGRTSGEERAQMDSVAHPGAPPFRLAADLFDAAWFGELAVHDRHLDAMEEFERQVLEAVIVIDTGAVRR